LTVCSLAFVFWPTSWWSQPHLNHFRLSVLTHGTIKMIFFNRWYNRLASFLRKSLQSLSPLVEF
jgi:hypothetical protein